jgi:hypothetical protein
MNEIITVCGHLIINLSWAVLILAVAWRVTKW